MSYISSDVGLPDFRKAVFSFWFRLPQASIDAAHAAWVAGTPDLGLSDGGDLGSWAMVGIIPLITFGPVGTQITSKNIDTPRREIGSYLYHDMVPAFDGSDGEKPWMENPNNLDPATIGNGPSPWRVPMFTSGDVRQTGVLKTTSSYIGVFCGKQRPELCYVFETGAYPDVLTGYSRKIERIGGDEYLYEHINTHSQWWEAHQYWVAPPPEGINPSLADMGGREYDGVLDEITYTYTDTSRITDSITAAYTNGTNLGDSAPSMPVSADEWHHVLLSIDLSAPCAVSGGVASAPKIWIALDDINYTGEALSAFCTGENGILTPQAFSAIGDLSPPRAYSISSDIPSGFSVGVPSTAKYTDVIRQVQMAELQIFTGVTLDTSVEKNRRAFINAKGHADIAKKRRIDADGNLAKTVVIVPREQQPRLFAARLQFVHHGMRCRDVAEIAKMHDTRRADTGGAGVKRLIGKRRQNLVRDPADP